MVLRFTYPPKHPEATLVPTLDTELLSPIDKKVRNKELEILSHDPLKRKRAADRIVKKMASANQQETAFHAALRSTKKDKVKPPTRKA